MKVQGRTFIISGGASGLGRTTAFDLVAHGGNVSVLDLDSDSGAALVEELGKERARFFECNVLETESIEKAVKGTDEWVQETGKAWGGVVAAAGVAVPSKILSRDLKPFSLSDFDFVMNINVRGTIDLLRHTLPHLARSPPDGPDSEHGVCILVASSAAFDGQPGQVAYSASKGAITSLTLPLCRDLAPHGIRVVTIAPSLFQSRMTSMMSQKVRQSLERVMEFPKREGKPEEFARLVREALENGMLNGTVLRLDGGMRMPSKM